MTETTNNTQLSNYEELVQLVEKIGQSLLEKYDLAHTNSEIIVQGRTRDEVSDMIIRAAHDNGTCASTLKRINLKELYKKIQIEVMKNIVSNLKRFDVNEEFNCVWDEDEFDMTSDEFMEILEEAQETFREKADHISQDMKIFDKINGIPKNTNKSIREFTRAYLELFTKKHKCFEDEVIFLTDGFLLTVVFPCSEDSGFENLEYKIKVNTNLIASSAYDLKISNEDILDFVSKEIREQVKAGLNEFSAEDKFNALKVKNFKLVEIFIKTEEYFKKMAEEIV